MKFFNSIVNIQFDLLCCYGSNSVTCILEVKGLDGFQLDVQQICWHETVNTDDDWDTIWVHQCTVIIS